MNLLYLDLIVCNSDFQVWHWHFHTHHNCWLLNLQVDILLSKVNIFQFCKSLWTMRRFPNSCIVSIEVSISQMCKAVLTFVPYNNSCNSGALWNLRTCQTKLGSHKCGKICKYLNPLMHAKTNLKYCPFH